MGKKGVGDYLVGHSIGQECQVVGIITRTQAQHKPSGFTLGVNIQRSIICWKIALLRMPGKESLCLMKLFHCCSFQRKQLKLLVPLMHV